MSYCFHPRINETHGAIGLSIAGTGLIVIGGVFIGAAVTEGNNGNQTNAADLGICGGFAVTLGLFALAMGLITGFCAPPTPTPNPRANSLLWGGASLEERTPLSPSHADMT